jgi:hypothetical protein
MKLENLNLGKTLTKAEQKQIKGGDYSCNTGQWIRCTCQESGFWCGEATSNGELSKTICNTACESYGAGTGQAYPGTFCGDPTCTP